MKHPIQPLALDEHETLRFKGNAIVRHILDFGGLDLNYIGRKNFTREDHVQFAQLIGYSLSGFGELSYVSDEDYKAAEAMYEDKLNEKDARIKTLEAKPTARTLNLDLTESLIKFSAMAENYEVMSQSEDTFHAMIKVLENRTYTNYVGNVKVEDDDGKEVGTNQSGAASNMARRARKWMKMV